LPPLHGTLSNFPYQKLTILRIFSQLSNDLNLVTSEEAQTFKRNYKAFLDKNAEKVKKIIEVIKNSTDAAEALAELCTSMRNQKTCICK
jgi:hypothetical protein